MKRTLFAMFLSGSLLGAAGLARADLLPLRRVDVSTPQKLSATHLTSEAAKALIRGDAERALSLADQAIAANGDDPWGHYNRGAALAHLRRPDEAVASYREAEKRFANDPWGKSVAIYGRAITLSNLGRCEEAQAGFKQYQAFVTTADPRAAQMAGRIASACTVPGAPIVRTPAAPSERQPVRGVDVDDRGRAGHHDDGKNGNSNDNDDERDAE